MNSKETEQIFLLNSSELQPSGALQKMPQSAAAEQGNLENVDDFSMVCRTCATVTEFLVPIFSGEGLQNNLADKIHKHLPIKVTSDDSLPLAVCYQCLHTLLAWHELAECCQQADRALRSRLLQLITNQKQQSTGNENNQIVESMKQKELEEIAEFVVSPEKPPPAYPATLTACVYCQTEHTPEQYKEHLIQDHAELLFHCDECDGYVDRKDFILHMSFHVVQYSEAKKKDEPNKPVQKNLKIKDENENTEHENSGSSESDKVESIENTKVELTETPKVKYMEISKSDPVESFRAETILSMDIKKPVTKPEICEMQTTNIDQNEFSDHSDTEFNFGPLPDSFFVAIDDSQDSQPENEQINTPENKGIEIDVPADTTTNKGVVEINNTDSKPPEKPSSKKKTLNKDNKNRTCPVCGKIYTASSSYFYHIKSSHKLTRDHECKLCNKKFKNNEILKQHMSAHNENREFECKDCPKKFKSNVSLYIHIQSHVGTKKFSCEKCSISFRWRTHLMRHLKRRHSGDKPFVCNTCGRAFSINCDLQRHIKTHSAGKYVCDKCGIPFAQERYLKVHLEKKHPNQGNGLLDSVNNANESRSVESASIAVSEASESKIATDVNNEIQSTMIGVRDELDSASIDVNNEIVFTPMNLDRELKFTSIDITSKEFVSTSITQTDP